MSAKGSDIKAGAAFVELYVKDEKLRAGLMAAQGKLAAFGHAAIVGHYLIDMASRIFEPVKKAVEAFAEYSDTLDKMSIRTGLAATQLSELAHAAAQAGTSLEDVEKGLKHMATQGMDTRRFLEVADAINRIENPARRLQRAIEIFGKRGNMLIPLLDQLRHLRERFGDVHIGLDENQIKIGVKLQEAFVDLRWAISNAMRQIAAAVAPAMQMVADLFTKVAIVVAGFARDFPLATKIVVGLSAAVIGLGTALVAVAGAATIAAGAFALLDTLAAPWILIAGLIGILAVEMLAIDGLLIYLTYQLAGLAKDLLALTDTGRKFLGIIDLWLKKWRVLSSVIAKTFSALSDAISKGDMQGAWDILLIGMTASWHAFAAVMFRDIANLAKALKMIGVGGLLGGLAIGKAGSFAEDMARGHDQAAEALKKLLAAKAAAAKGKQAGDQGYGMGEQSAVSIGFSARSAMMGRQIIGGGRDEKMLDKMTLLILKGAATIDELKEIKRKIGGKFN